MVTGLKEFILFFRMGITNKDAQPSDEQMKIYLKEWDEWINSISSQNRLVGGNHLKVDGRTISFNKLITDGPYTEKNESIAGYIIIKATGYDEAVAIASGSPILLGEGTNVEVREIAST